MLLSQNLGRRHHRRLQPAADRGQASDAGDQRLAAADIALQHAVHRVATGEVREVVLATGTSVEGESTAAYIAGRLEVLPVSVTRIAAGVPMGGDLKYVDQVTLKKAMESRRAVAATHPR